MDVLLLLVIIAFLATRYLVPILDTLHEYFSMLIAYKMNGLNITIAKNTREFEKSCEDEDVDVEFEGDSRIGFVYPDNQEDDEEDEEEDEWDETGQLPHD